MPRLIMANTQAVHAALIKRQVDHRPLRAQRLQVLGVGEHVERQHKEGYAEQDPEEPDGDHPVQHPSDEFHVWVPHPRRRTMPWRRPPKKSPTRSMTELTGSLRSVKQVPM